MHIWCYKQQVRLHALVRSILALAMVTAIVVALLNNKAVAQIYYLGVLAPQGAEVAQQRWQPWLSGLNAQLSGDTIVLVPLALENWQQQIDAQQFALVLGPQVQFIKMDTTGWRWLATLQANTVQAESSESEAVHSKSVNIIKTEFEKNESQHSKTSAVVNKTSILVNKTSALANEPSAMEQVASALWVKVDSDIYHLQDLQHRKIVAVDADAFGGYLLVAHLLQQNGVLPNRYQTQFVGYPIELTLSTLASEAVDAAIAPLCLMEEMARQGKIDQTQYRLIHPVATDSSCQSSTKIYPNWTLAATGQAPAALLTQINRHLFATPMQTAANSDSDAFVSDTIGGLNSPTTLRWLSPESSSDTERILYDMSRHPEQKPLGAHLLDWIHTHRLWVGIIVFIIIISTVNYGWMSWLAWRRRQQLLTQNRLIRDYDNRLRQSERFAVVGEMSGAIAHEINQPLATIQNYAQGLLIRSRNGRFDNGSVIKDTDIKDTVIKNTVIEKESMETALQHIVSETERAAAVISNIRHWAGRSQLDEVNVDIAVTYQQCIMLLGEKAVGMTFWFASEYQQLQLPSLLLDQLLINSVRNAQQHGAAHIMLRCQMTEYNGAHWLALHITDDAGGFDDARLMNNGTQDKPHSHSDNQYATRSTKADGLGLGLMICQRLCQSLDGMMQLSNVNVRHELVNIQAINGHYQHRLKRSLYSKDSLSQTDGVYPLTCETGAQVSLYLPMHLAKVADTEADST